MRFRDRDAPITPEGLIFRTYGYDHPKGACFCDVEYAPEPVYKTHDQRAVRERGGERYYKFYFDGGLRFVRERYPQYQLPHRALNKNLVGVRREQLTKVIRPEKRLRELMSREEDPLTQSVSEVLNMICDASGLKTHDFGVFGSLAHGFHHPQFSDIDLVIYGEEELKELRAALSEIYKGGVLRNEFEDWTADNPPRHWNFKHYSKEGYGWHQKRKLIYAEYPSATLGRIVKVEFEPVRKWGEIENEYEKTLKIENLGRVEAVIEVLSDVEAGFMPSIYPVEIKKIDRDIERRELLRVFSYVEEFRLQLEAGESALARGALELVETTEESFYQITLSQGPDYFDQVLKLQGR